jgi:hypothetical protein
VATETQQTLETFYDGFGGGWRWRDSFGSATTTLSTYTIGTLIIDLFRRAVTDADLEMDRNENAVGEPSETGRRHSQGNCPDVRELPCDGSPQTEVVCFD